MHHGSTGVYGSPRIHGALRTAGTRVSRERVARLMREAGLSGGSRRRRPGTTVRDPRARPAPGLVNRNFTAEGPNKLWVADITHVPTRPGALYLATVMDAWVYNTKRVHGALGYRSPPQCEADAQKSRVIGSKSATTRLPLTPPLRLNP